MQNYQDIENIINFLDEKMGAGVSRINLHVDDTVEEGNIAEAYHHGRCDVGSVWATGEVRNFSC